MWDIKLIRIQINQDFRGKEETMSLNTVNVMGNLTRDPENKHVPSGKTLCILSIASNRTYLKNNEKVNEVSYFDVEVWGAAGENCAKYLSKGSGVIVEGKLKQERWKKDGKSYNQIKIMANTIHFLPNKRKNTSLDSTAGTTGHPEQEAVLVVSEDVA